MKIAQIVCTFPPYAGGIGNSAYTIGEMLSSEHEVSTFFPNYKKDKNFLKTKQYLRPLHPILKHGNGAFLPQLAREMNDFDLTYLHYPFFGTTEVISLMRALKPQKTKLIVHYHMDVFGLRGMAKILSLPSKITSKNLLEGADAIVTSSLDYVKNSQIKDLYEKRPDKFKEIPFGVDITKFLPDEKKQKNKDTRILFVGGLDKAHYFKGVAKLIEAGKYLREGNWMIDIVGEGGLKESYQKR